MGLAATEEREGFESSANDIFLLGFGGRERGSTSLPVQSVKTKVTIRIALFSSHMAAIFDAFPSRDASTSPVPFDDADVVVTEGTD